MFLFGQRPLTASKADHRLFANRSSELKRVCRALELGFNAYVYGPPGIGKTSFLRQIQHRLLAARYVRLEGLGSLQDRLNEIEGALSQQSTLTRHSEIDVRDHLASMQRIRVETHELTASPLVHLRSAAIKASKEEPCIVLADDLSREECHELFGRLRDNMWELPIQWVVAGRSPHIDRPADTFFDISVELEPFGIEELREMVHKRADAGRNSDCDLISTLAKNALPSLAPCTPRRALSVLRDLYFADDVADATEQLAEIQLVRERLRPASTKILDAVAHYGPVHAGDERLLSAVGVTRGRIAQVLTDLEASGLVTSRRVGNKKLYSTTKASDRQATDESTSPSAPSRVGPPASSPRQPSITLLSGTREPSRRVQRKRNPARAKAGPTARRAPQSAEASQD